MLLTSYAKKCTALTALAPLPVILIAEPQFVKQLKRRRSIIINLIVLLFTVLVTCLPCGAQVGLVYADTPKANPGTIILNDGTEIEGLMRFYDKERIAALDENGASYFLGPADVETFTFYDATLVKSRTFVTIPYKEYPTSAEKYFFFEVLKELRSFALLASLERMRLYPEKGFMEQVPAFTNINGIHPSAASSSRNVLKTFSETLYFIDSDGNIEPYLSTRFDLVQGNFRNWDQISTSYINRELPAKYIDSHYKVIKKYARKNKLGFNAKEGLIRILDEYEKLTESASVF